MRLWTLDTALHRGSALAGLRHVHTGGRDCPCTQDGSVTRCTNCSATVELPAPLDQLPSLAAAVASDPQPDDAIVTVPLGQDILARLVDQTPVDAAFVACYMEEAAKLDHPLILAAT